ncbi:MAG TPA: hypothetical protein VL572_11880, partial [Pyrinomonadaceae bacterium]|nr:hypothetical protein [Pyrinomonadaceae bacterium]
MKSSKTGRWKRVYKIGSTLAAVVVVGYLVLLMFPQALFAYSAEHGGFRVYSREPIGAEMGTVVDRAEEKLNGSGIYDASSSRDIYLTGSHAMYAFLSHKAYNSFANSAPFIDNIIINKADLGRDRVIMNRASTSGSNTRSLSGVI